jgi:3-hydroxyisobutyrate dehydrogenase-like beta-hydroxyacid dehydrogenase
MTAIGFVGPGAMGSAIAGRLLGRRHRDIARLSEVLAKASR